MPLPTPYYYLVKHPPGFVVNITVNDIPFYRRFSDYHQAPNGPFNHWMLPGRNVVHLTLVQPVEVPDMNFGMSFQVLRFSDDKQLFSLAFPDFLDVHPEEERSLPAAHQAAFDFDRESPKPIWVDAPITDFPPEGTPEQRAAVFDLWDAKKRGDVDDFIRVTEMKARNLEIFYGHNPDHTPGRMRSEYGAILGEPWDVRPLDFDELVFERRGGGRTAYVTRKDGGPALFAQHTQDPDRTWEATLHLTMVDGRWRIFL